MLYIQQGISIQIYEELLSPPQKKLHTQESKELNP